MLSALSLHGLSWMLSAAPSLAAAGGPGVGDTYALHLLEPSGAGLTQATAVQNGGGLVVGLTQGPSSIVPAVWIEGVLHDLPLPRGTTQGAAEGVNKSGTVVGSGTGPGGDQAFVYTRGAMMTLEPLAGAQSHADDLNDAGFVVGASSHSAGPYNAAVLWTPSGLPLALGSPASATSIARAINEANQVVGEVDTVPPGQPRPFLWANGTLRMLEALPGEPHGLAADINDHGVVAGTSIGASPPGFADHEAVVWINGVVHALPMPAWVVWSTSHSINNRNELVGEAARHPNGQQRPFLWSHGEVVLLEDLKLTVPVEGWTFRQARDIDDTGRIVGWGLLDGQVRGFVLTPQ